MNVYYEPIPASDGTSLTAPSNAEFKVFEVADTARATPLELRTVAGTNAAPLVTTAQGVLPGVEVVSPNFSHIFKSGEWEWRRDSVEGIRAAAEGARAEAAGAAEDARRAQESAEEAAAGAAAPTKEAVATALTTAGPAKTALDASLNAVKPDNGGKPVGKGELIINVKDYGAKGDGVADDTAALQAWLDAGGSTLLSGKYRVTDTLVLNGNRRSLITDGAVLVADSAAMTMLKVTGADNYVRVSLDGNGKASHGIVASGVGHTITKCDIRNIKSTGQARGIEVESMGGSTISDNIVSSIQGGTIARAITLFSTATATSSNLIRGNIISDVVADEGDGIHVLYNDGGSIFLSAKTVVESNQITNVTRRFIKVQGSDVRVLKNTLYWTTSTVPKSPAPAIDVIQSARVSVEDNDIHANLLTGGIGITGTVSGMISGVVVSRNTVRSADTRAYGHIYATHTTDLLVDNNTLHGGSYGIAVGSSTRPVVKSNVQYGGLSDQVSFRLIGNTNAVLRDNTNMNSSRQVFVRNDGTANQSVNNSTTYNSTPIT